MLVDKVCKYKMDPESIVKDTEWIRFHLQKDGWTDGQKEWNQYPPLNFIGGGYNKSVIQLITKQWQLMVWWDKW